MTWQDIADKRRQLETEQSERQRRDRFEQSLQSGNQTLAETMRREQAQTRQELRPNETQEISNFPDVALREDIAKLIVTMLQLPEQIKPEGIDWQPLIQAVNSLGSKLEALDKEPPEAVEAVTVKNLDLIRGYIQPLIDAVNSKDYEPVFKPSIRVDAPKVEVKPTDIQPFVDAVQALGEKLSIVVEGNTVDLSALEEASKATTQAIKSLRFPVANYVLPFKDMTGKATQVTLDANGNVPVATFSQDDAYIPSSSRSKYVTNNVTILSTTETTLASAVTGTYLDLRALIISNTSSSAVRVDIRDTTGGPVRFSFNVPSGDTRQLVGSDGILQTSVNTNWTAQLAAAVTDVRIFVEAFKNT